ncbi:MAG: hypothetical protein A3G75_03900 [Verrucomicrobia bacterium RIFCSPLOWO2_12_FULL_64_8]|nr:MAG: hypothetical protein A3G75_03900 [Verrucomicrobia bacterium RIFCSPLOWO2_12_FULL_64_8]
MFLAAWLACATGLPAQTPAVPRVPFPAPSPAATVKQRVGLTDVEIVYSRPSLRGRKIFGAMLPYGEVWRTGANAATRITFSTPVKLQGASLAAGAYELSTIPGADAWTIIVQKAPEKPSGGAPPYKSENDAARMRARPVALAEPVATFTISIGDLHDTGATIDLAWENTRVPLKLEVDTVGALLPQIQAAMAAEGTKSWNLYYNAATLYYDNGLDLRQALAWLDEAARLRAEYPGIYLLKTRIHARLGEKEAARTAAAKAVETGVKMEGPTSVMARQARTIADSLK